MLSSTERDYGTMSTVGKLESFAANSPGTTNPPKRTVLQSRTPETAAIQILIEQGLLNYLDPTEVNQFKRASPIYRRLVEAQGQVLWKQINTQSGGLDNNADRLAQSPVGDFVIHNVINQIQHQGLATNTPFYLFEEVNQSLGLSQNPLEIHHYFTLGQRNGWPVEWCQAMQNINRSTPDWNRLISLLLSDPRYSQALIITFITPNLPIREEEIQDGLRLTRLQPHQVVDRWVTKMLLDPHWSKPLTALLNNPSINGHLTAATVNRVASQISTNPRWKEPLTALLNRPSIANHLTAATLNGIAARMQTNPQWKDALRTLLHYPSITGHLTAATVNEIGAHISTDLEWKDVLDHLIYKDSIYNWLSKETIYLIAENISRDLKWKTTLDLLILLGNQKLSTPLAERIARRISTDPEWDSALWKLVDSHYLDKSLSLEEIARNISRTDLSKWKYVLPILFQKELLWDYVPIEVRDDLALKMSRDPQWHTLLCEVLENRKKIISENAKEQLRGILAPQKSES